MSAASLQSCRASELHVSTPTRLHRASEPPYLHAPRRDSCSEPPELHTSTSLHLQRASRALCLYASRRRLRRAYQRPMPTRRYTYIEPLDLHTSVLPRLHACRAPPTLHTSTSLHLQRASSAPMAACLQRASRAPCL